MMPGQWLNRRTLGTGLVGLVCLGFALLILPDGVRDAAADDALATAKPCPAGAAWDADCLHDVIGTVAEVTQHPSGRTVDYILQAWTAHGYATAEFSGSNRLVRQAVGGDELVLTEWRGKVVAVSGYGLREDASAVALERTRSELAGVSFLVGLAMLLLPVAFTSAVGWAVKPVLLRGVPQFAVLACVMFGVVLTVNALVLGLGTDPDVDLAIVAGFFVAVLALCLQLVRSSRCDRRRRQKRRRRPEPGAAIPLDFTTATPKPVRHRRWTLAAFLETAYIWLGVAVCAAAIYAYAECVPGRAHDHAPICAAGVVDDSCRAETALPVRGIRTFRARMDIVFVGPGGSAVVATFDHSAALEQAAETAALTHSALRVELWRWKVWRVQIGTAGYEPSGEQRYETAAIVLLAASSGLFLIISRVRIRRRSRSEFVLPRTLWLEDVGQSLLLAAGIAFLEEGRPWAVLFLLGAAAWLIGSYRSVRPRPW